MCTCEVGGALSPTCLLEGGTVVYNGLVGPWSTDISKQTDQVPPRGGTDIQLDFDEHLNLEGTTEKLFHVALKKKLRTKIQTE